VLPGQGRPPSVGTSGQVSAAPAATGGLVARSPESHPRSARASHAPAWAPAARMVCSPTRDKTTTGGLRSWGDQGGHSLASLPAVSRGGWQALQRLPPRPVVSGAMPTARPPSRLPGPEWWMKTVLSLLPEGRRWAREWVRPDRHSRRSRSTNRVAPTRSSARPSGRRPLVGVFWRSSQSAGSNLPYAGNLAPEMTTAINRADGRERGISAALRGMS
jgi:hypothetical protein